jgi:hypothetical protein
MFNLFADILKHARILLDCRDEYGWIKYTNNQVGNKIYLTEQSLKVEKFILKVRKKIAVNCNFWEGVGGCFFVFALVLVFALRDV